MGKIRKSERNLAELDRFADCSPIAANNCAEKEPIQNQRPKAWTHSRPSGANSSTETTKDTCRARASRIRKAERQTRNSVPRECTPFNRNYTRALRKAAVLRSAHMDPESFNSPFLQALLSPRNGRERRTRAYATCEDEKNVQIRAYCEERRESQLVLAMGEMKRKLEEKDEAIARLAEEKRELERRLGEGKTQPRNKASVAGQGHNRLLLRDDLRANKERIKDLIEQLKHIKSEETESPPENVARRPNSTRALGTKKIVLDAGPLVTSRSRKDHEIYRTNPFLRPRSSCGRQPGPLAEKLAVLKGRIVNVVKKSAKQARLVKLFLEGMNKVSAK